MSPRQDGGDGRTMVARWARPILNLASWATNWELDVVVEDAEFAASMEPCTWRTSPARRRSFRYAPRSGGGPRPAAPARPAQDPQACLRAFCHRRHRARRHRQQSGRRIAFAHGDRGQERGRDRGQSSSHSPRSCRFPSPRHPLLHHTRLVRPRAPRSGPEALPPRSPRPTATGTWPRPAHGSRR